MDIRTIVHHIRNGVSERQTAKALGVNRRTVRRYHSWARENGLLTGDLPPLDELQRLAGETLQILPPPQNISSVEPYRALVEQLTREGVEIAAIRQRLMERGYRGSYSSVYRFVHKGSATTPEACVRVERAPGEEAQVDFGYAGLMIDPAKGTLRRCWAFVMTLSYSRHQYVEFVFDQKVATWLLCHSHSFAFFEGVPARVVIDNLKTAIARAIPDDPQVEHSYRQCAEHYGFLIAPCRVSTPEHKGKVEQGGVHYVKRNFLSGRTPTTITQANADVWRWCLETAGLRIHGTIKDKPLLRFEQTEKGCLAPLPPTSYDQAVWKRCKLHRDCHVVFEGAYYSAPYRLIGQMLLVSGGLQSLRIYSADYQLIATHERAERPGERRTHPDHLPPYKLPALLLSRPGALLQAEQVGPYTRQVIEIWLSDPLIERLSTCGRLLKLRDRYSDERLEAACARALSFADPSYITIKRILQKGIEDATRPLMTPSPPAAAFVRSADELLGHLKGGDVWN